MSLAGQPWNFWLNAIGILVVTPPAGLGRREMEGDQGVGRLDRRARCQSGQALGARFLDDATATISPPLTASTRHQLASQIATANPKQHYQKQGADGQHCRTSSRPSIVCSH
jgi:hypothetical protein